MRKITLYLGAAVLIMFSVLKYAAGDISGFDNWSTSGLVLLWMALSIK